MKKASGDLIEMKGIIMSTKNSKNLFLTVKNPIQRLMNLIWGL